MKQKFFLTCAASFLAITFTPFIYAYNEANSLTFTLGAGGEFFSTKRELKNVTVPFLALGYNFTETWGIEGLWGTFKTNFKNKSPDEKQVSGTLVLLDGIYRFNPYNFVAPFIMAGVGITGLSPNRFDANSEGNINAGVGVEFFANKVVAFRIDARDIYTMVGGKNDVYVDAGVSFLLDLC